MPAAGNIQTLSTMNSEYRCRSLAAFFLSGRARHVLNLWPALEIAEPVIGLIPMTPFRPLALFIPRFSLALDAKGRGRLVKTRHGESEARHRSCGSMTAGRLGRC
jgi:hypothetical protein